ncbi:hypothetical protein [Nocardia sp. NBC_01009]|nr:hypothetical protein OHA42_12965 [Nocardia sp. NBC_01009]
MSERTSASTEPADGSPPDARSALSTIDHLRTGGRSDPGKKQ